MDCSLLSLNQKSCILCNDRENKHLLLLLTRIAGRMAWLTLVYTEQNLIDCKTYRGLLGERGLPVLISLPDKLLVTSFSMVKDTPINSQI